MDQLIKMQYILIIVFSQTCRLNQLLSQPYFCYQLKQQNRHMSFIKSDSLLSNIKNVSIRIDMKPNDGSNIFKSIIFNNPQEKEKSIKLQSLFDYDGNRHNPQNGNSLVDRLINPKEEPVKQQAYHYNWLVCKNSAGLSQQEDNAGSEEDINVNPKEQEKKQSITEEAKTDSKEIQIEKVSSSFQKNQRQMEPEVQIEQTPKKLKNETKNIPKNYGKAIICFIERYHVKVSKITQHYGISYEVLLQDLKKKKKSINTIADLRNLWSQYKYAKCMRVITYEFLRKHSLSYIFDSRICTFSSHIKYRSRLSEAVGNPSNFKHIKDY